MFEENIDGSVSPLVDNLSYELYEKIVSILEEHSELERCECSLEIEGRLGYIKDTEINERIKLPIESETLLSSELPFSFVPGISKSQFHVLQEVLKGIFEKSTERSGVVRNKFKNVEMMRHINPVVSTMSVHDEFRGLPSDCKKLRFTYPYPRSKGAEPLEILRKENLLTWTIYSGADNTGSDDHILGVPDDEQKERILDYRIVINIEFRLDLMTLKNNIHLMDVNFERIRRRLSFSCDLFSVDTTIVQETSNFRKPRAKTSNSRDESTAYEVEVELNEHIVLDFLNVKKSGGMNSSCKFSSDKENMMKLCGVFIGILRDMCCFLNSKPTSQKLPEDNQKTLGIKPLTEEIDLMTISQPIEVLQSVIENVIQKPPLIGDYIYREVLPNIIKKSNKDTRCEKLDIYEFNGSNISGPWGTDP